MESVSLSLCVMSRLKVEQPKDVVTGNPTVIKMLVNFYRHARGHNALRESLGPALQDVLLDRTLSIRTDPVDVYKTWINQTETQTGHKRSEKKPLIHSTEHVLFTCQSDPPVSPAALCPTRFLPKMPCLTLKSRDGLT